VLVLLFLFCSLSVSSDYIEGVEGIKWGTSFLTVAKTVNFELLYRKDDVIWGCFHTETDILNTTVSECLIFYNLLLMESVIVFNAKTEDDKVLVFKYMELRIANRLGPPVKVKNDFYKEKPVLLNREWETKESYVTLYLAQQSDYLYDTFSYDLVLDVYCKFIREYALVESRMSTDELEMKK